MLEPLTCHLQSTRSTWEMGFSKKNTWGFQGLSFLSWTHGLEPFLLSEMCALIILASNLSQLIYMKMEFSKVKTINSFKSNM
jgi:hypothetical protein